MSLTDWVEWDRELIDTLFDKPIIPLSLRGRHELLCSPLTKNYATVGVAFDYVLRLEVARENNIPLNIFPLVAENGAGSSEQFSFIDKFDGKRRKFMKGDMDISVLLGDCLVLAKIESQFRSGQFWGDDVFNICQEDVADLGNLIKVMDKKRFRAEKQCILNPTFGRSSNYIGGADADLIIDNRLIEIKTTKLPKFEKEYWRQIVGYWLLNRRERYLYGVIEYLEIYFSRFGWLLSVLAPRWFPAKGEGSEGDFSRWNCIEDSLEEYREENKL